MEGQGYRSGSQQEISGCGKARTGKGLHDIKGEVKVVSSGEGL